MPNTNTTRARQRPSLAPKRLYGILATAEMFTWGLLILGMVLKYSGVSEAFVPVFGLVHGVTFISYCVVTCFVWVNQRWSAGRGLAGLLSAFIPFCTVPFERATERRGLLEGGWRLTPAGESPHGFVERVQALCLRFPIPAVVIGLVFVAAVTSVLLVIGPPVPRG